jgi:nucleotide-binding universal stress UspA family protein
MDSMERRERYGGNPERRAGRVIVGVDGSLGCFGALRHAVAEARRRGAQLCAVRVVREDHPWVGVVQISEDDLETLRERIQSAFDEALGGVPEDLAIRSVVMTGEPGPALVEYASREEDLLVVGASWRRGIRRLWQRPVGAYCARHARCPVLTVPLNELAWSFRRRGGRGLRGADLSDLLDA